jgi:hypothetical protein
MQRIFLGTAIVLGVAMFANGAYMLLAPSAWYFAIPGVTTTGPFNQHFIRDIGMIFLFIGAAFGVGALREHMRVLLWAAATFWLAGHALFHFWEVAVRICAPPALARDFPGVTLPAILGTGLTIWAYLSGRARQAEAFTLRHSPQIPTTPR